MAYFDDGANSRTYEIILTNSGGATFTNGLTVSAGASISYDASHMLEITGTGATITGDSSVTGSLKATTGLVSNSITIGGSVSSATVVVTGSGAFSQDLTAKSTKLTGAQLPIVNTLDVAGSCNISGDCNMASTCEVGGLFSAFSGALINNNCTISSVLTVGTISPPIASGYGTTTLALGNTVAITGNVSIPGYLWAARVVGSTGSKYNTTGQVGFTVSWLSGYAAGVLAIKFASAHPLGANYVVNVSGRGVFTYVSTNPFPTTTAFVVVILAPGTSTPPIHGVFSFTVLAG